MRGLAGPATKIQADFRDLFRVAAMSDATSTVLVIDDDPDLRASVGRLLRSLGINVQLFGSISDFLKSDSPDCPTCLVLDIRLPGQSGLDLQRELAAANREIPIIFITGPWRHTDVRAGNEAGCHRVPDQAVPRPGSSRCHSARSVPRSCAAGK